VNRLLLILAVLFGGLALALPAAAQNIAVVKTPAGNTPVLGSMMRPSSDNTFSISTASVVTWTGTGVRLTTPAVTAPSFTLTCNGGGLVLNCLTRSIHVTVTPSATSGSATITMLRIGGLASGAYLLLFAPADAASLSFDLLPIGSSASFTIGMDVLVPANATPGLNTFSYTVTAAFI
jgi:hypothetical protein